uniref:Protein NIM1-INTERACTING 1 n=1 Tax=Cucumis melo TaxID=3656 RepID=A0A9I9CIJ6_CUCME
MEGERKRRKLQNNEKEEEEENEEEEEEEEKKIELFYALIQNTKAMRDRTKYSKELTEEEKLKGVWNPKFQPEDFIEEDGYYNSKSNVTPLQLSAASSSTTKQSNEQKQQQEQGEDEDKVGKGKNGLDLNLSL